MSEQVSLVRLYLLRVFYLLGFAFVGSRVWPGILFGDRGWEPLPGVAISVWAALSALFLLGVRYPLAMLPLLLFDLLYKVVWLAAVWLPMRLAGPTNHDLAEPDLSSVFIPVVAMLLVFIPWPYVLRRFVRARGDMWTRRRPLLASADALVGETVKQSGLS